MPRSHPGQPKPPPTLGARAGDAIAPNLLDDEQSDESEAEPEEPENESDETDEDEEDEEDGDDTGQGSEEEEEEQEQEQDTQEDFVAQGVPEIVAADHGGSAVLFPPPPAGLQFQQALHDLDEALGQLAYAVQEFQEAISSPDTPEPALAEAQNSKDQDIVMSIDEKRKNPDTMTLRQRSHNRLNTPPVRLDMAFFPHSGKIQAIPRPTTQLVEFLKRPIEFNDNKGPPVEDRLRSLTKRYHFVRTLEKDVELRSLREEYDTGLKEIGVLCPDAVTFSWFQERSHRLRRRRRGYGITDFGWNAFYLDYQKSRHAGQCYDHCTGWRLGQYRMTTGCMATEQAEQRHQNGID
ncbi:hypothetical protein TrVFT333_008622 [Trichoderma virens FT-333]|nr:hypothetical protein TrVFT333_008622 [Trichoderma virens FT-333]